MATTAGIKSRLESDLPDVSTYIEACRKPVWGMSIPGYEGSTALTPSYGFGYSA
jgi:hypothetical protein